MKKHEHIIILILIFFLCTFVRSSDIEFVSIDCPDEIIITEETDLQKLNIDYAIKYKYVGDNIIYRFNKMMEVVTFNREIHPSGQIYYIDKNSKILPGALRKSKQNGFDLGYKIDETYYGGSQVNSLTVLKKDKIYSYPFNLLSSFMFDDTDIDEAIKKRELSTIIIIIEKIELIWRLTDRGDNVPQEDKIILDDINRVKIIKVKYKNKKPITLSGKLFTSKHITSIMYSSYPLMAVFAFPPHFFI